MPHPSTIFHDGRHYRAVPERRSEQPSGLVQYLCFDGGREFVAWADAAGAVRLAVDAYGAEVRPGASVEVADTGERGKVEAVQGAYVVVQLANGEAWRGRAEDTRVEHARFASANGRHDVGDYLGVVSGARAGAVGRVIKVSGSPSGDNAQIELEFRDGTRGEYSASALAPATPSSRFAAQTFAFSPGQKIRFRNAKGEYSGTVTMPERETSTSPGLRVVQVKIESGPDMEGWLVDVPQHLIMSGAPGSFAREFAVSASEACFATDIAGKQIAVGAKVRDPDGAEGPVTKIEGETVYWTSSDTGRTEHGPGKWLRVIMSGAPGALACEFALSDAPPREGSPGDKRYWLYNSWDTPGTNPYGWTRSKQVADAWAQRTGGVVHEREPTP